MIFTPSPQPVAAQLADFHVSDDGVGEKCAAQMKRVRDWVGWGLQALFSRYGIAMLSTRYSTCSKQNAARTVCSDGRCRTKGFANSHDCILIL